MNRNWAETARTVVVVGTVVISARQGGRLLHSYLVDVMTTIRAAEEVCLTSEQCFIVHFNFSEKWKPSFGISRSASSENSVIHSYFQTAYESPGLVEKNIGIACIFCKQNNVHVVNRENVKHLRI